MLAAHATAPGQSTEKQQGTGMKKSFVGLDWLRFFLALYIVIFHTLFRYPESGKIPFLFVFYFGGFATSTFFMLSGFLLSHVYFRDGGDHPIKGGVKSFLVKRFANIYPIHLISLVLVIIASVASTHSALEVTSSTFTPYLDSVRTIGSDEAGLNLTLQLFLLQAWNPLYLSFNAPTWSLSNLAFFYVVFPFIAPSILRIRRRGTAIIVVFLVASTLPAAVVMFGWHARWIEGLLHINPLVRLPEFIAGILTYSVFSSLSRQSIGTFLTIRPYLFALALCSFVAGAHLFAFGDTDWKYFLHNGALMFSQMTLILCCAIGTHTYGNRTGRLSTRLGNSVLSIFALHEFVFMVFSKVEKVAQTRFTLTSCFHSLHTCVAVGHRAPLNLAFFPVYLAVTVAVALVFQDGVVNPLRKRIETSVLVNARAHDAPPVAEVTQ
ncbi:acyltransferase [Paraburkholderia sp.]|uniref:acyltransferase family protein n=1 Tax=Paraburkholderia sp. TaxID=1926495 RepID=UPI002F3FCB91